MRKSAATLLGLCRLALGRRQFRPSSRLGARFRFHHPPSSGSRAIG